MGPSDQGADTAPAAEGEPAPAAAVQPAPAPAAPAPAVVATVAPPAAPAAPAAPAPSAAPERTEAEQGRKETLATKFLDFSDSAIYLVVGVCFLLAAIFSLVYGLLGFAQSIDSIKNFPADLVGEKGIGAQIIITLVSDLLLTLIIMEVLGTVVHHLRDNETTLKPFLFIGIISATRGILAVGARLSVSANITANTTEFTLDMIELGVNAAVIIALGVAMKLIGPLLEDGANTRGRPKNQAAGAAPSTEDKK